MMTYDTIPEFFFSSLLLFLDDDDVVVAVFLVYLSFLHFSSNAHDVFTQQEQQQQHV
jgi:hypothetical protein